jgi:hypothetical protein
LKAHRAGSTGANIPFGGLCSILGRQFTFSHELINDITMLILPSDNDEHGEEQTESDNDGLDDLRNGKSQMYKSEFLKLLSICIPEPHRDSRQVPKTDTAITKKFLELKKEQLQHLAREKGIKGVSTSSISSLTTVFGGFQGEQEVDETNEHALSVNQKVIETILKHSFMPHQKGKLREHCSRGHQLELPISLNGLRKQKIYHFQFMFLSNRHLQHTCSRKTMEKL